jgi:hypothetical protein
MRGAIGSLNAAVAGSIMLFEAVAQRDPDDKGAELRPAESAEPAVGDDEGHDEPPTEPAGGHGATDENPPTDKPARDLLPGGPPPD